MFTGGAVNGLTRVDRRRDDPQPYLDKGLAVYESVAVMKEGSVPAKVAISRLVRDTACDQGSACKYLL